MLKSNNRFENLLNINKIDYLKIKKESYFKLYKKDEYYDINIIIPIKGRKSFIKPLYKSLISSSKKSNLKICFTIVEMSETPEHKDFCEKNNINFIYIKSDIFNKCLAMNFGAMFSIKSKSFIFHDLDCLVQSDFFLNLEKNIKLKKSKAIQCFTGRRVLYLDEQLTSRVIKGEVDIDKFCISYIGISVGSYGAPGGSIYVEKDIFFEVGGYDPEFFTLYAPEDAFFWDKIEMLTKIDICDSPVIDLFHMSHESSYNANINYMIDTYNLFKSNDIRSKLELILEKKNLIKSFYNGDNKLFETETIIVYQYFKESAENKEPNAIEEIKQLSKFVSESEFCQKCGQIKNKIRYNFCQKCNKLY